MPLRRGAGIAKGVDVGHHVVPQPALRGLAAAAKSMRSTAGAQLGDLRRRDRQAELGLGFGQGHPQPAPGAEFALRPPQPAHFGRGVAVDQRIVVGCVRIAHREQLVQRNTGRGRQRVGYDAPRPRQTLMTTMAETGRGRHHGSAWQRSVAVSDNRSGPGSGRSGSAWLAVAAPSACRGRAGIIGRMVSATGQTSARTDGPPIRVLIVDNEPHHAAGRGRKPGARRLRVHRGHQRAGGGAADRARHVRRGDYRPGDERRRRPGDPGQGQGDASPTPR